MLVKTDSVEEKQRQNEQFQIISISFFFVRLEYKYPKSNIIVMIPSLIGEYHVNASQPNVRHIILIMYAKLTGQVTQSAQTVLDWACPQLSSCDLTLVDSSFKI